MIYKAAENYLKKTYGRIGIKKIILKPDYKIEVIFFKNLFEERCTSLELLYEVYIDQVRNLKTIKIGIYDSKKADTKQKT